MCGIFGAVGCALTDHGLDNVFHVLHHRGPDGRGLFVDSSDQVTLAHTRLAVIDLETGAQPLQSEDGDVVLIVNGEIYDFERIRNSLEAKGYVFKTKSDSEIILRLYQEHGLGCFEYLRGEFAFLLYDRVKRRLIAARDRFGIKPLYFSRSSHRFVFASEMKAIFASQLVAPKLSAAGFDPLIDHDPHGALFPFEGIEHVPPASYLTVDLDTGEAKTILYWSDEIPADVVEPVHDEAGNALSAAQTVLEKLEEAIRLRLRADVPVGLYLSGGIDSAFVAALMKRNLSSRPHSFSISFEGSGRSEGELARRAAECVGTEHHDLAVTKQMLWDNLEEALWFSELPFVTLAPVGKFLLSEEARKFVTVVLTGEGADEVFLGYRSFFQNAIRETRRADSTGQQPSAAARRLKLGPIQRWASLLLFHKKNRSQLRIARARLPARPKSTKPLINEVQESRIAAMPFDILCYLGDREEMAHSLEARLPFLDHELYDAARSIPIDLKIRNGLEKAVLRDAAKDILPEDVRLRRKSGFMLTSEAVDLFGADRKLAERLGRYLSKSAFERAGVFSYGAYVAASMVARLPARTRAIKRLRRNSNKLLMYMMQVHMLHDMFIANPRWNKPSKIDSQPATVRVSKEDSLGADQLGKARRFPVSSARSGDTRAPA